eukprot:2094217-Prymnesium_polylepis.2
MRRDERGHERESAVHRARREGHVPPPCCERLRARDATARHLVDVDERPEASALHQPVRAQVLVVHERHGVERPRLMVDDQLQVEPRLPVRYEATRGARDGVRGRTSPQLLLPRRRLAREQLAQPDRSAPLARDRQRERVVRDRPAVVLGVLGIERDTLLGEEGVGVQAAVGEQVVARRDLQRDRALLCRHVVRDARLVPLERRRVVEGREARRLADVDVKIEHIGRSEGVGPVIRCRERGGHEERRQHDCRARRGHELDHVAFT